MTNTNSKMLNPKKMFASNGQPVLDTNNQLDLHCWCEDKKGNVIYDPHFPVYEQMKKFHSCEGAPLYDPVPDWKILAEESLAINADRGLFGDWENPLPFSCVFNAYSYAQAHPTAKFMTGRFGWKKTAGGIHWEFG